MWPPSVRCFGTIPLKLLLPIRPFILSTAEKIIFPRFKTSFPRVLSLFRGMESVRRALLWSGLVAVLLMGLFREIHANNPLITDIKLQSLDNTTALITWQIDFHRLAMDVGLAFVVTLEEESQENCTYHFTHSKQYNLQGIFTGFPFQIESSFGSINNCCSECFKRDFVQYWLLETMHDKLEWA